MSGKYLVLTARWSCPPIGRSFTEDTRTTNRDPCTGSAGLSHYLRHFCLILSSQDLCNANTPVLPAGAVARGEAAKHAGTRRWRPSRDDRIQLRSLLGAV